MKIIINFFEDFGILLKSVTKTMRVKHKNKRTHSWYAFLYFR